MREEIFLDRNWIYNPVWDDSMKNSRADGETVSLPHTVAETPFHYFDESVYQKVSCYQRFIRPAQGWEDKSVRLTFMGAAHAATVYLNGEEIGTHRCGYTAFTCDLTGRLRSGEDNLLSVRLDSRETLDEPPFGFVIDYMTYGGLYRDVKLVVTDRAYLADVFVRPMPDGEGPVTAGLDADAIASLKCGGRTETDITLSEEAMRLIQEGHLSIRQSIDGDVYLEEMLTPVMLTAEAPLPGTEGMTIPAHLRIAGRTGSVSLWDTESPKRYTIVTELLRDGNAVDRVVTVTGFRTAVWKADGFYLNGRKLKLRGLNRHQSYPYTGYAMPQSIQREDVRILKEELGVNIVRTSHYPQSQDFIDECDRRGLLVFTEIPGWQHIGGDAWKDLAVRNVHDMVVQYRNHPSIVIWGVRINESADDDAFYARTNACAHALDDTRATGGVRCRTAGKGTNIQEDVFTYNDFSHDGTNAGCLPKNKATNDMAKAYLVTEYNGHMYPTKSFDCEEHRMHHAIRHARVIDAIAGSPDIAGGIGWCMADYNTHKDFGSGDRICYHGVLDMWRNPKMAAYVYAAEGSKEDVLYVTSSMDIGEHPASNRGDTWIVSNADSVRMYKDDRLLKEYYPSDSPFKNMRHGPILIDDFIGNALVTDEHMAPAQAAALKELLNLYSLRCGKMNARMVKDALKLILNYHMHPADAVPLFQKYIGNWGGKSQEFRFDAVKNGEVVKSVILGPVRKVALEAVPSAGTLIEDRTYDMAAIRVRAVDQYGNVLPYYNEPLEITVTGPAVLVGPDVVSFEGGMTGTYIRSVGMTGTARVTMKTGDAEPLVLSIPVDAGD